MTEYKSSLSKLYSEYAPNLPQELDELIFPHLVVLTSEEYDVFIHQGNLIAINNDSPYLFIKQENFPILFDNFIYENLSLLCWLSNYSQRTNEILKELQMNLFFFMRKIYNSVGLDKNAFNYDCSKFVDDWLNILLRNKQFLCRSYGDFE